MTKTLEERATEVINLPSDSILCTITVPGSQEKNTNGFFKEPVKIKTSPISIEDIIKLITDQQARIRELEAQKDGAYSERNQLVAALSKLFPSWMEWHSDEDISWDNDWRNIVFIELPTGQVSWHIHDSEVSHFQHLRKKAGSSWDGHTTEEKYKRLAALISSPEKKVPYLEMMIEMQRERIHDLAMRIHHAKEVYIGMDGFKPETAPEGYCLKLLKDMYNELKYDDNTKNTTENPDNGKYHSYTPTEAEIEAAAEAIFTSCANSHPGIKVKPLWNESEQIRKVFRIQAKNALEAAAKVRGK